MGSGLLVSLSYRKARVESIPSPLVTESLETSLLSKPLLGDPSSTSPPGVYSPIVEAYEKSRRFKAGSGVLGHLSD